IRDVAREMIRALGHKVEFATNGNEAVEKYQEAQRSGQAFDVVILDLTIRGGIGGAETVKKLLEIDPEAKVVVSSGYSNDSVIASYERQGFKAVLKKPYNIDELQQVLKSLLNT
ncbi:MAG TPA: response regulator, partial [Nitrospirota bacterium]|nr:response regulator [Nitrospirota bacterium]